MIIILVIFIIVLITFFCIFYYKNINNGNTISNKSEEKIIDDILNMKSYNALISIKITTNKNETNYVVTQKIEDGKAYQEIQEPENLAGVITEYDGKNLKIRNNKLNLETTFQDYQYIVENRLWIDSFIEEYKHGENTKIESSEDEIILQISRNDTPYNVIKKLYISKKTCTPTKMIVQDINQKTLVYILYTEIRIS